MRLRSAEARRYLSRLHFERPAAAGTAPGKVLEHVAAKCFKRLFQGILPLPGRGRL